VADIYLQANKKTRNRAYDLLIEIARACEDILEAARGRRACTSSLTWYFYVNCSSLYQSNSLTISFIALYYYDMKYLVFFATSLETQRSISTLHYKCTSLIAPVCFD
jgi:hypothetical protein